jgi:multidrug efflux pump subunit AcrA (membrane-fusion protein)
VIEHVDVDDGEEVSVGRRVARVVSLERIEVPLRLPAAAREHLGVGDAVRLSATSGSPRAWTAPITRIAPVDDRDSRTIAVYVEMAQDDGAVPPLAPGQFVQGAVSERQTRTCWVVPRQAISADRIMVVNGNRIVSRPASIQFQIERRFEDSGLNDDQWVAIAAPLAEGDLVVVHNGPSLMDGQMVQPVVVGAPPSTAAVEHRGSLD